MKKFEFVITGGPCAGKTTAINIVKQDLENKGFKVIVIPETATELINSGICPWDLETVVFQEILISRAINKEENARRALNIINGDVVVIYDRGILDAKAYMKSEEFEEELKKYNLEEEDIVKKYDAVFHLVTAANGAEKFYTLSNNTARKESLEDAIVLDKRTRDVWKNHKNFKLIDNSTDFEEKMNRLLKEINILINKK